MVEHDSPPLTFNDEPLHMEEIPFLADGEDRYIFLTPDLITARRIGWEITKQVAPESLRESLEERLQNPEPIEDLRMDGIDTSYSEIPTDKGDIEVHFYLRNYAGQEPYASKLKEAITALIDPALNNQ